MRETFRAMDRASLEKLRLAVEHARAERKLRLRHARATCKRAKETLRVKLKERRRAERERLRREAEAARRAERSACKARKAVAARQGDVALSDARRALQSEKLSQRRSKGKKPLSAARVYRQESDDEAKRDLPEELHGAWEKHRKRFTGSAKMSRAQQFLEWVHENPEELLAFQVAAGEADVDRMLREREAELWAHQKKMKKRKTRAEIEAELKRAGVPF